MWSLGTYVYDHWGDVEDFAGKAGDVPDEVGHAGKHAGKSVLKTATFGLL